MEITLRDGGPDDVPAILGMLDGCVEWLVAQGRTEQWGTKPLSQNPGTVESVRRSLDEHSVYMADVDGRPAGTLTLAESPGASLSHLPPPGEPERYIRWLATDRRFGGRGVGSALLAHAARETRRAGVSLLRVDCYAGHDGGLVRYYESQGFTRAEAFTVGEHRWPGRLLARRL
ncbi:GNAT family N-acetyltransferase [Streptomyces sp. AHA2]|uniref:GNAT family N-acetyltransferase n=1 Tax=Streptomyces sp. AHA2 TaxID=3064526 RepID=UPI002FE25605